MLGCKNIYLKDILLFRFADHILVGDEVLVEGNDKFAPLRVVNITNIMMQGHYRNLSDKTLCHLPFLHFSASLAVRCSLVSFSVVNLNNEI